MIQGSCMLACFSLDAGALALIGSLLVGCLIGAVLVFVNLGLIVASKSGWRFKVANLLVFATYAGFAATLCLGGFGGPEQSLFAGVFGVPVIVFGHFVFLLCARARWRKSALTEQAD